jgi:DNA-directed RNA polymerase beta' subunit
VSPTQDVVLGSYYLTQERLPAPPDEDGLRRLPHFSTPEEASLAYEHGAIQLHDQIRVRIPRYMVDRTPAGDPTPEGSTMVTTTVGRVIFNEALPLGEEGTENPYPPLTFYNGQQEAATAGQGLLRPARQRAHRRHRQRDQAPRLPLRHQGRGDHLRHGHQDPARQGRDRRRRRA